MNTPLRCRRRSKKAKRQTNVLVVNFSTKPIFWLKDQLRELGTNTSPPHKETTQKEVGTSAGEVAQCKHPYRRLVSNLLPYRRHSKTLGKSWDIGTLLSEDTNWLAAINSAGYFPAVFLDLSQPSEIDQSAYWHFCSWVRWSAWDWMRSLMRKKTLLSGPAVLRTGAVVPP